ncbi:heavy metal-associated domain-containing protein [Pseudohongiella sp. SYSU M77423]|jgi:copper chaperone|uniref:heavy-metal-associated domain-containing protein n=1 Tax=Pseudohongiella TaxID=1524249 RepID=UPI0009F18119|nr:MULTISPECIES: heavy metal-associated domain-containing protein [Pseudohongiella]MAO38901.1 copper-transporting ATPase [Pseudohongiella sp.]MAY54236.1 copper-transporting ATPase [Gammaproteobacteria bacterium]MDH7942215.1 heavy metal-associated domain-containing protein [Pseudohongiella sp. SYSU M77423]MEC8859401.1 heavy metal-associated domain-containing protein [Pseudomonadota bacterium]MBJ55846.1 copper-transporting ATPase [Gammaproteobacteria bacterium]
MNTQNFESPTHHRDGCCCASKSSTVDTTGSSVGSHSDIPLQRLQVQGATCGGCVKSIEQTLRTVSGVNDACMDLATGVASVVGMVESSALIEALDRAGFPSTQIN